uniref:Uncharacterized protein n=1 Tax=Glossina palpalis gambiensis TaxID=67801 RepID=A0A1B0BTH5_9MUSC
MIALERTYVGQKMSIRYIYRVGHTAPAGRACKAITFVTQMNVEQIEHWLGKQLPLHKCEEDEITALQERVTEALRTAKLKFKKNFDFFDLYLSLLSCLYRGENHNKRGRGLTGEITGTVTTTLETRMLALFQNK